MVSPLAIQRLIALPRRTLILGEQILHAICLAPRILCQRLIAHPIRFRRVQGRLVGLIRSY